MDKGNGQVYQTRYLEQVSMNKCLGNGNLNRQFKTKSESNEVCTSGLISAQCHRHQNTCQLRRQYVLPSWDCASPCSCACELRTWKLGLRTGPYLDAVRKPNFRVRTAHTHEQGLAQSPRGYSEPKGILARTLNSAHDFPVYIVNYYI